MLTKVFNVLDGTLFSQSITGNVAVSNGPTSPISDFVSLLALGSWDVLIDFNGTMSGGFASVQTTGVPRIEQVIDIDYLKVLTGLPSFAKVKKMVINTPYSINVDMETDANYNAISLLTSGSITTIVNGEINNVSPGILTGNGAVPGQPPDGTDILLVGIATVGSAAADHEVFDFTGTEDFFDRTTFANTFDRITFRDNIFIAGIVNNIFGATNVDCIYVSSLGTGWTITVSYENEWELNPKVMDEENPTETVFYLTATEADVEEITNLYAYPESGGGFPGGTFEEITDFVYHSDSEHGAFAVPYITFSLSQFGFSESDNVTITAEGTQFSGEVEVQLVYAVLVDGSGLYTLVPGKRNDTYYDRAVTPPVTIDLPIPTPRAKTGFFNA